MPIENLIKLRRGTASQWDDSNPILESGEPGFDLTNKLLKIGDGTSNWNSLSFIANGSQIEKHSEVSNFPNPGLDSVIYISSATNRIYSWNGTVYVQIGLD